ncbi:MAG: glycosyltransferase family 4 protein [Desulfuromonadales bacterium]
MRILMLSQWFDPEPAFKGMAFAKELVSLGHQVEVLTGFPNYPGGKLYDGYRVRLLQREVMDGITVIRVPLYPSHDSSALKRIANYLSFAFSAAILGTFLIKPADVMYVYHPPATVGFAAAFIGFIRRIPFVYDIQDLWPDTLGATGMLNNHSVLKLVDVGCHFVYRQAAKLVVLSPGFKKTLCTRGIPEEKIDVIYNWCDEVQQSPDRDEALAGEINMAGRFNLVFAGTMGKLQALDAVLDAAKLVAMSQPEIQFVFIGGGIEVVRLKARVDAEGIDNCLFLSRRPVAQIGQILGLADVLLVHLRDEPLFRITIPSKTQAYMAARRPILMAVRGDAADLVKSANAGICCSPEAPEDIAKAVLDLYSMPKQYREQMGINGQEFYDRKLSLKVGTAQFDRLFHTTIHQMHGEK